MAKDETLVHLMVGKYYGVALCGASNEDDNDAPASDDPNEVTCAKCWAMLPDRKKS
jgi:hypothetical protein